MKDRKLIIETDHAWLERTGDLVLQRWKTGFTLNARMLEVTSCVREEFLGDEPYVLIEVVPSGNVLAEGFLESGQDHDRDAYEPIIAMAHVVEDEELRTRVSSHNTARSPRFERYVCGTLAEALAWADGHLTDRGYPAHDGSHRDRSREQGADGVPALAGAGPRWRYPRGGPPRNQSEGERR